MTIAGGIYAVFYGSTKIENMKLDYKSTIIGYNNNPKNVGLPNLC